MGFARSVARSRGYFTVEEKTEMMHFNTDKQTTDDLNIFGKPGGDSVFNIYNHTATRGGSSMLEEMFTYPMADADAINERIRSIQHFSAAETDFPFNSSLFSGAELYLALEDERTRLSHDKETIGDKVRSLIAKDHDYQVISNGVLAVLNILFALKKFLHEGQPGISVLSELGKLLEHEDLTPVMQEAPPKKMAHAAVVRYDDLLRFRCRQTLRLILRHIYILDVYISVAKTARHHQFVFPKVLSREMHTVHLENVYHPLVKNAVPNTLRIMPESNIVFLTGANMAGKSTFMKSLGIAMYVAHIGFPVAAGKMEFSVRDGIYTTINLSDNLSSGSSHFYAEVLRIKKVAQELSQSRNLFIIFDELFRGTNVKDACDATIAITGAFASRHNCMFIVSTHIIEAGEVLKEKYPNIRFTYMPTTMQGNTPVYSYQLRPGITEDRHGMVIINNEGILDIIRKTK
jgi:DNA mismatch repair protein MutS